MLQPDILVASQYFDRVRRRHEHDPERRLMFAILEDAVDMYCKHAGAQQPRRQQLFREAEEWIENRDPSWFFSFESIAHALGLEADYLRRGLHTWKERALRNEPAGEPVITLRAADQDEELRKASND